MNEKITGILAVIFALILVVSTPLQSAAYDGAQTTDDVSVSDDVCAHPATGTDGSAAEKTSDERPDISVEEISNGSSRHITLEPVIKVNPLYAGVTDSKAPAFNEHSDEPLVGSASIPVTTTLDEFAEVYRNTFNDTVAAWGNELFVRYKCEQSADITNEEINAIYYRLLNIAEENQFVHNGVPTAGDYACWQYNGIETGAGVDFEYLSSSTLAMTFTVYTGVTYYTTPEQEAEETAYLNNVLESLELDSKTEYGKVKAIYDFICSHVTYDFDNLDDNSYMLKHTSYAALINGTSVCQGYATLFYRMALEAGLDARVITGSGDTSRDSNHAWNIVRLKGLYYNLDATWDAEQSEPNYFLKGQNTFNSHIRDVEYDTAAFHTEYPMSATDYKVVPSDLTTVTPTPTNTPTSKPTNTPTPKPTNTPTPKPTNTPTPKPTNTPTPKPTNTPTPKPTNTPTPKPTNTPTPKPTNTPTPKPTNTPTPKPTNTPTPKPTPTDQAISIASASISGISLSYGYTGREYTPTFSVIMNGVTLTAGTDYTYIFRNNINPGTARLELTGKGKYTGSRIKTFEIVDCVSSIVSGKTYQLIPKNNSSTAVSTFSGKTVNNTKVYITDRSSSEAMSFKAVKNSDGTWKFINAKCELALAVQQNSSALGAGLVIYDQTTKPAQNWKLSKKSDNSFAIMNAVTGYSIAMSDASAVKGTTLSMAQTASNGLQRFYIAETDAVNAKFDGTYAIRASKDKTFALNIASSSKDDGANVNLYKYSNVNAKKFKVIYSGGGYYRLANVNSGMVLTVKGNTKTNGANVVQSKWAALSGQRWQIIKNSDGTVTLKNGLGTVLHLDSNKTLNGTNVMAKTAASTKAQRWYLG